MFNQEYTAPLPQGIRCIYNMKNKENWRQHLRKDVMMTLSHVSHEPFKVFCCCNSILCIILLFKYKFCSFNLTNLMFC
jgi:hypothetical protein